MYIVKKTPMKKKLIHISQSAFLKCDNPNCDYELKKQEEGKTRESYINKSCPECGENLLTKEDYERFNNVIKVINFINKWFGWLGTYPNDTRNVNIGTISTHQEIKIE